MLIVAAAYTVAGASLGEQVITQEDHRAADRQTGASGDIQVALVDDRRITSVYEMKMKRVTRSDIDQALVKVMQMQPRPDHLIFITTEAIDEPLAAYCRTLYARSGGIEVVILNCIGFARHFLHLFHRLRVPFLDAYQALVLAEPDSAVSRPVKEAFLILRQAAERTGSGDMPE
jgi:hypothetical protein